MTDEDKKKALRDVLFDPRAPVGIAYDITPGRLTITVYVPDPAPPGTRVLASITLQDVPSNMIAGLRGLPLMAFFPEEKERIDEFLGMVDPERQ